MAQQQPNDVVEKIEGVAEKRSPAQVEFESYEPENRAAPNKAQFESLMTPAETDVADVRKVQTAKNSIVEEVANVGRMADQAKRTPQQLVVQAQEVIGKIDEIKQKLNDPTVTGIRTSAQQELRNKLSHIDDGLRAAMARSGIEYTPPPSPEKSQNVIERFLGLLTDSQDKIQKLTTNIEQMSVLNQPVNPAAMIVMQMKVGAMQQQIELFSTMLSKSLEGIKTVMNVQV